MQMAGTQLHVLERAEVIFFYFVFLILLVDIKFLIIGIVQFTYITDLEMPIVDS